MAQIYSGAEPVVAWFGLAGDDSEFLIEHVIRTARLLREGGHKEVVRAYENADVLRRASLAFREFCKREYWRRLWVIQEFCCAERLFIMCGEKRLDYEELRDALLYWNNRPGQVASPDGEEEKLEGYIKTRMEVTRAFKTSASTLAEGIAGHRRRYWLRKMHLSGQAKLAG